MKTGRRSITLRSARYGLAVAASVLFAACSDTVTAPSLDSGAAAPSQDRLLSTSVVPGAAAPAPKVQGTTGGLAPRFSSQVGSSVPESVIVSYEGLEWVWASPCALNGCTSGILVGKDGFDFATASQWAKRPPVHMFAGKCAAPWFDTSWDHCDWNDPQWGYLGSVPSGGTGQTLSSPMASWSETWLVRGPSAPVDATAPVITASVSGTQGPNGWYTSDVTVSFVVSDPESAITSQNGCVVSSVQTDTAGQTFTCTAGSAGGSSSESVTVKRDATGPVVSYTGNAGAYTVDQTVAITCSASDALSGIASQTCADVNGAASSFSLGSNSFTATATDAAGNSSSVTTSFTVSVSSASLCVLVQRFVSNAGVANSMCKQLQAGSINAFINHVSAQSGKSLSAANAQLLISLAGGL